MYYPGSILSTTAPYYSAPALYTGLLTHYSVIFLRHCVEEKKIQRNSPVSGKIKSGLDLFELIDEIAITTKKILGRKTINKCQKK